MDENKEIVYDILKDISLISMSKYNELIKVYGKMVVDSVVEQLICEDENNRSKFIFCLSDDNINDLYVSDINNVACLNTDKNFEMMVKIDKIIKELNVLFEQIGLNDTEKLGYYISDKVNYCINNSSNHELLNKLKRLYQEYCDNRDKVIEENLKLVIIIARSYRPNDAISFDDIIQYGNIGLMKAIEKFDINKGVCFSTYAHYWINQSILRNIRSIKYPYKIPDYIISKYNSLIDSINKLSFKFGRTPSKYEISLYTDFSLEEIDNLICIFADPISLDSSLMFSSEDDMEYQRCASIADSHVEIDEMIVSKVARKELLEILSQYLTKREYLVLMLYYGFYGREYNVVEIANMLDISKQRVSKLNRSSIKKLKLIPSVMNVITY